MAGAESGIGRSRNFTVPGEAGDLAALEKWPVGEPRGVILLVHGATYTGMTAFDFRFPGGDDYSLIDHLVRSRFACVTFAVRGYGGSHSVADGLTVTTEAAIADTLAVADWIRSTYGYARTHLLGWSWGGRISSRFAEAYPDRVERLVLFAPAVLPTRTSPRPGISGDYRDNVTEATLARIEPDFTDPAARQAFADYVIANEPRSPNGVFDEVPVGADPANLTCPTMLIYGAADAIYRAEPVAAYFTKIANDDKALVLIPGAGHFLFMQKPRHRFYRNVELFLGA